MSGLKRRVADLERALVRPELAHPCNTCGAPARLKRGLVVVLRESEEETSKCPSCGRTLDPRDGCPVGDDCTVVVLIRGIPPAERVRA